jgi:hypothetical protein
MINLELHGIWRVAIQVHLSKPVNCPRTREAMKARKLSAVFALVLGLCLPTFSRPSLGSLPVDNSGGNGKLRDGHSQGPSNPTHPKGARHKKHKATKHKNPHKKVRH